MNQIKTLFSGQYLFHIFLIFLKYLTNTKQILEKYYTDIMMAMDALVLTLNFVLGLALGSYLNSWIWRTREGKWKFLGRSMCVHCGQELSWYENIPLFSFLWLRGKCSACKIKIPTDYFWVELFSGLMFIGLTYYYQNIVQFNPVLYFRDLFFLMLLLVVFVYDAKYSIILPGVIWAGALIGLVFNYLLIFNLYSLIFGLLVGGGFFLIQYLVSRGRWIGGGDVRLGAMMGVWLGWPNILVALFFAYITGALAAIPLLIQKKKSLKSAIPFGTFLAVGTAVAIFWGDYIINWYWGLIGY